MEHIQIVSRHSYDPNSEAPPPMNPGLMQKVSSHYIGPGKDARRSETTNLKSTLQQFRSAELAIGSTPAKTLSAPIPQSTEIQQSVYYILAKLWCGNPPYHGGNAVAYGGSSIASGMQTTRMPGP